MLTEWIKAMQIFVRNGYHAMTMDVNNKKFSKTSILGYHAFFLIISFVCVIFLPKGISGDFIDYIKDIFAIFIGFFVTALTLIYDKLNIAKVPTQKVIDRMPADKRPSSEDLVRMKQERNYAIRFFYSIGFNILFASLALFLLILNIFWNEFFSMDIFEYRLIDKIKDLTIASLLLGGHIVLLFIYRLLVILLIVKVFFYTVYMITSLLQVLISKKKI